MDEATRRMEANTLEGMVDRYGLDWVVAALAAICQEKAEHVRSTWQDEALAAAWQQNGVVLDRATGKLHG